MVHNKEVKKVDEARLTEDMVENPEVCALSYRPAELLTPSPGVAPTPLMS